LYLSGEELYLNKLQKKYRKYENINFYPMIPNNMVGEYLRNYHIGIIIYWKNRNAKNAMPNKFFQYITSGLMLMSLKNTEMGNFIDEHKIGITLEKPRKKILRNTLKHIDLETINFFRKSSIETAKLQSASTNSKETIRKFLL
jgi:hypothetical protein